MQLLQWETLAWDGAGTLIVLLNVRNIRRELNRATPVAMVDRKCMWMKRYSGFVCSLLYTASALFRLLAHQCVVDAGI